MSNLIFGRYHYGRYRWAGVVKQGQGPGPTPTTTTYLPNTFTVVAYAADGTKTAIYGAGAESNALKSLQFELTETGCGTAQFLFSKMPQNNELSINQRLDVFLFNDSQPWWSGYISQRPAEGSSLGATGQTFTFKADGYYNKLSKVLITATYEDIEVSEIVQSIAREVETKCGLRYSADKIISTTYIVSKITFDHVTAKDALKTLSEFGIDYVYGVDEARNLYFKPRNNEINEQARFWVGEHLTEFVTNLDFDKLCNQVYIKGGELDEDGEQWIAEASDTDSIDNYGYSEVVVDLPSAYGVDDAERYAELYIANHKNPTESAKVQGIQLEYDEADGTFGVRKLTTQGKAYIVDRSGTAHTLPITKLKYSVAADKGISCDMTLGELPEQIDRYLANKERDYRNAEALNSANAKQLKTGG